MAAEDPDEERKPPSLEGFRGVLDWSEVADDKVCCRRGVLPLTKEDQEVIELFLAPEPILVDNGRANEAASGSLSLEFI